MHSPPLSFSFPLLLILLPLLRTLSLPSYATAGRLSPPAPPSLILPSDAVALLSFKSQADLDGKLLYTLNERFDYCQWQGVKCVQGRVVGFVLRGFGIRGVFAGDTLTRLDQLRVLSLRNNSLRGPIPDLAGLFNLKSLFLDQNNFSGTFPLSLLYLHRLLVIDLSRNNLTGSIPANITALDRLSYLRLDSNRFNGTVPPLNQSYLKIFNVSNNNLGGAIPVTPTILRFGHSSFAWNPNLCGEIIHRECDGSAPPFFNSSSGADASPPPNSKSPDVILSPPSSSRHRRVGVVLGFGIGALVLFAATLCLLVTLKKSKERENDSKSERRNAEAVSTNTTTATPVVNNDVDVVKEKKLVADRAQNPAQKSGNLIFCPGETPMYNLEQLMRASAELLGRGTIGITYKAAMDNRMVVSVKRLDAGKTAISSGDTFYRHMELVGGLRHPNLVPVRAYFQSKGEKLVVYDFQPNGSLFNLIHGTRSTRAKPLHWTSCLKIAEDVAEGLAYIHEASRLVHGNLKSSNVLLGSDFEACLTDYCLTVLADPSCTSDPDSEGYKAPEIRNSSCQATPKADVYAFGILLLELLTGKPPSQHPFLAPTEVLDWVRAMREDDVGEDDKLGMLVEAACIFSLPSPEHRPLMRQALKMIQDIKERVVVEDETWC
ncbi:Non-specific serine/threonine protein kinase [Bertholletia excelsa]